jgi:aryl-alcohol dehydrogenase-like predicted oxidoreductase
MSMPGRSWTRLARRIRWFDTADAYGGGRSEAIITLASERRLTTC